MCSVSVIFSLVEAISADLFSIRRVELIDVLFAEFDFERPEFNLFREKVKFAVVSHIVELLFVTCDFALCFADFVLFLSKTAVEVINVSSEIVDACVQAFEVVLKVFHFEGKLAADDFDAVDFSKDALELIERAQTGLHALCF